MESDGSPLGRGDLGSCRELEKKLKEVRKNLGVSQLCHY